MRDHDAFLKGLGIPVEQPELEQVVDPALATWRTGAAKAHGLPAALAERLTGDSEAAVYLDAQRLAKAVAPETSATTTEAELLANAAAANAERVRRMLPGIPSLPANELAQRNDGAPVFEQAQGDD